MNNSELNLCAKKGCSNPVLDGKYCEHCKKLRTEKRNTALQWVGGIGGTAISIALAVIFRKPPNIGGK